MGNSKKIEPEALLFESHMVDESWHALFCLALSQNPDWLVICQMLVDEKYSVDETAADGYSRLAWALARLGRTREAIDLYEQDLALRRIRRWQFCRYIEQLLVEDRTDLAEQRVRDYYRVQLDAVDGYSVIAQYWQRRSQWNSACELYERDRIAGRASVSSLLNLAESLARSGEWHSAANILEDALRAAPDIRDGYARCAWHYFWPRKDFGNLIRWMEKDRVAGRLSPGWLANLACAYSGNGEFERAVLLVGKAYQREPSLRDGYARCAWQYFWPRKAYGTLIDWMEKDRAASNLSPAWLINLACAYSAEGEFKKAVSLIESAYKAEPSLIDGYARCAWQYFWPRKAYGTLIDWMEKDRAASNLSPAWHINIALAYAASGEIESSVEFINRAYSNDSTLNDGFVKLAWFYHYPRGEFDALESLCRRDIRIGRGSGWGKMQYAKALFLSGFWEDALELVENSYASDRAPVDAYSSMAMFEELNLSQLRDMRDKLFKLDLAANRLSAAGMKKYLSFLVTHERLEDALDLADRLKKSAPFDPLQEIGMTLFSLGHFSDRVAVMLKNSSNDSLNSAELELHRYFISLVEDDKTYTPKLPENASDELFWATLIYNQIKASGLC